MNKNFIYLKVIVIAIFLVFTGIYSIGSVSAATQCSDCLDNDRNGFIDYPEDPGCSSATDTEESPDFPVMYLPQMPLCIGNFGTIIKVNSGDTCTLCNWARGVHRDNTPEHYSYVNPPSGSFYDGNALDWYWIWIQSPAYIEWDLNQVTNILRVFPSQDHGAYINGSNKFNVKVSLDRITWTAITATQTYVDDINNIRTHDGVIDFTSIIPFRYVRITPNLLGGADLEIDAIRACQHCTTHASKRCVGNAVYWFDSCGNQEGQFQGCTSGQACQNTQCVDIVCTTNANCGINEYVGNPFCQSGNIFQNFRTYICNNPGTANSVCSDSVVSQLKTTCGTNQTCSNGVCINITIACTTNANCGTNGYIGSPFCQSGNIYQNFRTYTCNNPGTANSVCSDSVVSQLKTTCGTNQTCSNGVCINITIACTTNAGCGTNGYVGSPFCQSGNIFQNFRTYICNNPGTANSVCSDSVVSQLKTTCGANQTCFNGACVDITIACTTNAGCGTNGYVGSPFCQSGNIYQNFKTFVCNNPGTANSVCSDSSVSQLKTTCGAGQTCSNGICSNIVVSCSTNSECGTNGFIGNPYCQNGDIYQNFKTFVCNNPGTANSVCSDSSAPQLKNNCGANQTCSNGVCSNITIACTTNAGCGTNGYVGSPFCQSGNIYQNFKTFVCNNPGTANSVCSDSSASQLKTTCGANQTCSNGSCSNIIISCNNNSDCGINSFTGNPYCQNGDVYQNFKTFVCNSPGTANSVCSDSSAPQLKTTCATNQTCSNGSCSQQNNLSVSCYATPNPVNASQQVSFIATATGGTSSYTYSWSGACSGYSQNCYNLFNQTGTQTATVNITSGNQTSSAVCSVYINQNNNCTQNYQQRCVGNAVYWYDSCGAQGNFIQTCSYNQTCSNGSCSNSCTNHYSQRCSNNNLYWFDSCGNQQEILQYCANGCQNNICTTQQNITVQTNSATNISNNQATLNGYVYNISSGNTNYVWFQWGTSTSYGYETQHQTQISAGAFNQNIANLSSGTIYHFRAVAQSNNGGVVYGSDMTFTAGSTNLTGNLISVTKTARNLSSGNLNWSNSLSASPSDVLMFLITIQATGNQNINNVIVKDVFPANLIYRNQLIVSGSNNYTGDIPSGINFGTIPAGQTVTITYQAQVASPQNFSYGTVTLNNGVSVNSSEPNSSSASNFPIVVTRAAIFGATSISTGLTNNFLIDSFFLPLIIALMGVWLFRSGIFGFFEKWIDNRKLQHNEYKVQKELKVRITQIKQAEKN